MQYAIYSTRGVVEWLIKHEAKSRALSDTRPLLECCKSRTALRARINWLIICHSDVDRHDSLLVNLHTGPLVYPLIRRCFKFIFVNLNDQTIRALFSKVAIIVIALQLAAEGLLQDVTALLRRKCDLTQMRSISDSTLRKIRKGKKKNQSVRQDLNPLYSVPYIRTQPLGHHRCCRLLAAVISTIL